MTMNAGGGTMETQMWTVAEAKAKFSEVIDRALREGPQTITRNGRTAAVIVGADEWQRKSTRVGNLAEFFAASSLRGSGLKLRRLRAQPRKIKLRAFFSTPMLYRSGSSHGPVLDSSAGWNLPRADRF